MAADTTNTYVFNIQHYSLHDGPGIRTIVFLKGCPMHCRWCCNPESQKYHPEISYVENKCIGNEQCNFCQRVCPSMAVSFAEDHRAVIDRSACIDCLKCQSVCPSRAIKTEGKKYSVKELADLVEKDAVFYSHGNGGLTVSGGEPLTHREFLVSLLKEARRRRIHTAIETCGQAPYEALYGAAAYLDMIHYDIKSMNSRKHKEYTGFGNEQILSNFERLCRDYPDLPKIVRTPVIPGFNDTENDIKEILSFLQGRPNVTYEPLPYHSFGKGKYKALGRPYEMGDAVLSDPVFLRILALTKSVHL